MEVSKLNQKLSASLESGIFRFEDSNSVFIDPVLVLNQLYIRFMVFPFFVLLTLRRIQRRDASTVFEFEKEEEEGEEALHSQRKSSPTTQACERFLTVFNNLTANETANDFEADFMNTRHTFSTSLIWSRFTTLFLLRTIVASISLWLTTTGEWKCPLEVEVKADGSLILELGLFHHSLCKCIILGQCHGEAVDSNNRSRIKTVPDNRIVSSVPGDYSRKPPIGGLLKEYSSGHDPTRCLELFAREMMSGLVSWGNEPLDFQDSQYFYECGDGQCIYTKALFFGRHF